MDVTTANVNLKLPTLKLMHAKTMGQVYDCLKTGEGKIILNGWKAYQGGYRRIKSAQESSVVPSLHLTG